MDTMTWACTGLVVTVVVAFAAYVLELRQRPAAGRTKLPRFDRFGEQLGRAEAEPPRRA